MILNSLHKFAVEIIIFQAIERGELVNKAGIFEGKKLLKVFTYEDYRFLSDKGIDILNCKNEKILNKLIWE